MNVYDIFPSEGGYRVCFEIYRDNPVISKCPWYETMQEAEAALEAHKRSETAKKRAEKPRLENRSYIRLPQWQLKAPITKCTKVSAITILQQQETKPVQLINSKSTERSFPSAATMFMLRWITFTKNTSMQTDHKIAKGDFYASKNRPLWLPVWVHQAH